MKLTLPVSYNTECFGSPVLLLFCVAFPLELAFSLPLLHAFGQSKVFNDMTAEKNYTRKENKNTQNERVARLIQL